MTCTTAVPAEFHASHTFRGIPKNEFAVKVGDFEWYDPTRPIDRLARSKQKCEGPTEKCLLVSWESERGAILKLPL